MTDEQKEIKKWSNEKKVEALAKFVALRSGDTRKALLYGFILDCLLDEINKGQAKIEKLKNQNKLASEEHEERFNEFEAELEKKDKIIDEMATYIATLDIEEDICSKTENEHCDKMNFGECEDCIKQYFKNKVEE